jgi:AcrR family transcriptional regulator
MARSYQLKRRAERQDRTRQRIIDATIELHQTVGPAATTVTDIAERAGVGRVTVYRHFPDEPTLARACSGQYFERHPAPDLAAWKAVKDPDERLRGALDETYAYHGATEAMMTHVLADARDHEVMAPYHEYWRDAADALLAPFRARGGRRTVLRAAIALALSFDTWRTLVRDQGLSHTQAIDVARRLASDTRAGGDQGAPSAAPTTRR